MEKLGPPHNAHNFEIARFCNRDQASRDLGILLRLIQSSLFGFSFTNSSKRRTAVAGLIFNIEAVLASTEGGTTKRPWAGARNFFSPGECSKRDRNAIAYLDAGDSRPDRFDDSRAFASNHGRKLRIQKVHSVGQKKVAVVNRRILHAHEGLVRGRSMRSGTSTIRKFWAGLP